MPEIEFTINEETGEMNIHIEGIRGQSCADVARVAKEVLGAPSKEENTPEYFVHTQLNRHIKGQGRK